MCTKFRTQLVVIMLGLFTIVGMGLTALQATAIQPGSPLKGIYFWRPGKFGGPDHYENFSTFSGDGGETGLLAYRYPAFHAGAKYTFKEGDRIGIQGGIYRVIRQKTKTFLELIPEKNLPKGLKPPAHDSFTIPLDHPLASASGNIRFTHLRVQEISAPADKKEGKPIATIGVVVAKAMFFARVKEGDILLVDGYGYPVRAVVPDVEVAGWVEFAPHPIPEADLIRDKKAFVRPMPKEKEKK